MACVALLVLGLLPIQSRALSPVQLAAPLPALVLANPPLPGDSSIQARLKACLLLGDLNCVVEQYLLLKDLGRVPGWLVAFQNAFSVANRKAGECERVARNIYQGLIELGQRPQYLRLTVVGRVRLLGFNEFANGLMVRNYRVAETGQHVAVKLGDRIIDAYTGFGGLSIPDYMARLSIVDPSRVTYEVVTDL
jgi:hypothetical protein